MNAGPPAQGTFKSTGSGWGRVSAGKFDLPAGQGKVAVIDGWGYYEIVGARLIVGWEDVCVCVCGLRLCVCVCVCMVGVVCGEWGGNDHLFSDQPRLDHVGSGLRRLDVVALAM